MVIVEYEKKISTGINLNKLSRKHYLRVRFGNWGMLNINKNRQNCKYTRDIILKCEMWNSPSLNIFSFKGTNVFGLEVYRNVLFDIWFNEYRRSANIVWISYVIVLLVQTKR